MVVSRNYGDIYCHIDYWSFVGDVYQYVIQEPITKIVDVSNDVFYIDGSAKPNITFTPDTTYIFDLSHNSNAGNTFVLGTIPDSSINLIDYQTIVGTPGQPGAYTTFTASGETVFYYSFETPAMGYEPPTYKVKMDTNVLGDTVFSIQKPGETEYYIQPDLSFGAGFVGLFDVADIGSYSLVFGTEVDVSSTIQRQYYSQTGDIIVLSIPSDYSSDSLKYFEDTSSGMGYVSTSTNSVFYVEISNNVFYIDSSANPQLTFTPDTTYVFDLSHNSNTGNTFVLGTVPDSSVNLIDYQTVVGTPGQPGAYTTFTASGETVYYYSFETPDMGYEPPTYKVKTDINVTGDTVFSIKKPGETVYYAQPDLSFGAGFVGQFDVADIGSYSLVFGTEVDVSSTVQTQYFSQNGDTIILSIPDDYSGNSLVYFEDTSAGMGYYIPKLEESSTTPEIHYTFEEGTGTTVVNHGSMGTSANATITDTNSRMSYITGKVGTYSLYRNTRSSGTGFLDFNGINPTHTNGFTFCMWMKYTSGWDNDNIWLGTWYDGQPSIFVNHVGIQCGGILCMNIADINANADVWHHYTIVLNCTTTNVGTNQTYDSTTYYDGIVKGSTTYTYSNAFNGIRLFSANNQYNSLQGAIDDVRLYNSVLSESEILSIVNPPSEPISYSVTVSNEVFYIDGSANPNLIFTPDTTYIFDLSHNSNTGNTFVLGTVPDSSTNLIDYQTIIGTPGQPGAYASFTATSETVYYYSFETPYMGYQPSYTIVSVSKYSFYPGETTTIRVKNATPYDGAYTITLTGISQSDLNNADLSGSIQKQAITDFTYSIPADVTNVGSFTYSIDGTDISATIQITEAPLIYRYTVEVSGGVYWLEQKDNIGPLGSNYQQPSLPQFESGFQYEFHYTDNNHPIKLSTTIDGTHGGGNQYTTGVTIEESADTGVTPHKLILIAEEDVTLHYYCDVHSGYGDTGSSTAYITFLDNMKIHYTFDISTNLVSGQNATVTNSGSAGESGDATLQPTGSTHTLSYSTDSKVGSYSLYNNTTGNSGTLILPNVYLSSSNGFTYMMWIKVINSNNGPWASYVNVSNEHIYGYSLFYRPHINTGTLSIGASGSYLQMVTDGSTSVIGTGWHHYAVSGSNGYLVKGYVDGQLVTSELITGAIDGKSWRYGPITTTNGIKLFASQTAYSALNGYMDDIRFYDEQLPDSEILRVYNETV